MTIKEFCEAYKAKKFMATKNGVDERSEYLKRELGIKEYITFDEKRAIAKTVLAECARLDGGVVMIDSIQKYLLFTMAMIAAYTNLSSDEDMTISESYDLFCAINVDGGTLLDAIIKTFEVEYIKCNDVLNMMTADLLAENNIEKQVGKFFSKLSNVIDDLGDGLIAKIEDLGIDFSQLDIEKLVNMINKIK